MPRQAIGSRARGAAIGLVVTAALACWSGARAEDAPASVAERARALADAGDLEQAEALLSRRLAILPYDTEARLLLARLLDWNGEVEDAIALLDYACGHVECLTDEASTLARQSVDGPHVRRRRGELLRSAEGDPATDAAWKAQRRARAIELYEKAISLAPRGRPADEAGRGLAALRAGAGVAPACSTWSAHRAGR